MLKSEYKNIYLHEETHFIYVSMHASIEKLINKYSMDKSSGKNKLKILDAGCGTGGLLKKLSDKNAVYGIDISAEGIKLAKKRGLENLKVGTVTKLPYRTNTFDVVVCIDVLYHQAVSDDLKALSEFKRVLKPRGILILKVPAYNWLRGKHDSIAHTKHRFTKPEVIKKLKKSRLKPIKTTYANGFIFPLALTKRLVDNFSNEKPHSDVTTINPLLNRLFIMLSSFEDKLINWFDLPFGLTIFSVASKSSKDRSKKNS